MLGESVLKTSELRSLLDELCTAAGVCVPPPERRILEAQRADDVDELTAAVLRAAGIATPEGDMAVYEDVRARIRSAIAKSPSALDLFVLDTLVNDIEGFEDALRLLNHAEVGWTDQIGRHFDADDLRASLTRLIKEGYVEACVPSVTDHTLQGAGDRVLPPDPITDLWFRITPRGRWRHRVWAPAE